jgi:DNA-binding transcriptional LysR family regulator
MIIAASNDAFKVSFMELRHLQAFITVAEERHFGRAADRLGISQPPLSRQIQQLEAELGVKLFSRNSRSVELTKEGAEYLAAIRPHLDGLERAADVTRISQRKLAGKIRAGFVSSLAFGFVPRLLESLRKIAPGVAVELSELASPEQLRGLRDRRIDIGLVMLPVNDPGVKMRLLFRERIVAMLPSSHPAALLGELSLNALSGEGFIVCPRYRTTGYHETILELCRSSGFEPRIDHEVSGNALITELIASGLGVSLVPESAKGHDHPGVVYRTLVDTPSVLEIAAVWLEEAMTPILRTFLDQAIETAIQQRVSSMSEARSAALK